MRFLTVPTSLALALSLLHTPARAQTDVWVDPNNGSDSASGLSPNDPWRSLTFALDNVPPGATVRLLPGTYSVASGEAFPIQVHQAQILQGEGSADSIRIDSVGAGSPFQLLLVDTFQPVELRNFTLEGNQLAQSLLWVEDSNCTAYNVHARNGSVGFHARTNSLLRLESCSARGHSSAGARAGGETSSLEAWDSIFADNPGWGVAILAVFDIEDSDILLVRCRVTDNGMDGVRLSAFFGNNTSSALVRDCVLDRNAGAGFSTNIDVGSCSILGSTLAANGQGGLLSFGSTTVVRNSILAGNQVADAQGSTTSSHSLSGDGSLGSGQGNLSGLAGFVDFDGGDYRLRFDSPCIDSAAPGVTPTDRLDRPRTVDGDLNLLPAPDMGAFEHQTLGGPSQASIGDSISLFTSGPEGGFSSVVVSFAGFAPFGSQTPHGRFFLEPAGAFRLTPVATTGGLAAEVNFVIPMDPALVGTSTGFQALPRSFVSPSGAAFSNPILVEIGG